MNDESDDSIRYIKQINERPFVHQFLEEMSKYYEIIIFTAGTEDVSIASWLIAFSTRTQ